MRVNLPDYFIAVQITGVTSTPCDTLYLDLPTRRVDSAGHWTLVKQALAQ